MSGSFVLPSAGARAASRAPTRAATRAASPPRAASRSPSPARAAAPRAASRSPSPSRRAATAPARARGASPQRRSASPARMGAGRAGPGGSGNFIVSPDGTVIKIYSERGGQLTNVYASKLAKLMADGVANEAWLASAHRYQSNLDAQPEAKAVREALGKGVGMNKRAKKYYYNSATNRVSQKDPSRAKTDGASPLHGPFDSLEAANAEARRLNPDRKAGKAPRLTKAGVPYKAVDHSGQQWVRAGAVLKNGERAYIVVGGPKYNELAAQKAMIDGAHVDQLPQVSNAQKLAETAARSSARRVSSGTKETPEEKRARGVALARSNAARSYSLCVVNPTTGTSIGVEDSQTGQATLNARKVAKETGLDKATSKSGGVFVVSDAQVVAHIRRKLADGTLKPGQGKKCVGK